jgi:hypothetical protein
MNLAKLTNATIREYPGETGGVTGPCLAEQLLAAADRPRPRAFFPAAGYEIPSGAMLLQLYRHPAIDQRWRRPRKSWMTWVTGAMASFRSTRGRAAD